jgi:hypothetical protein
MRKLERGSSLLALFVLLTIAPAAQAAYDPIASGTTKWNLDPGFVKLLKKHGVKLTAAAPAKLRGGSVVFPVSGGKFDPTIGEGTVEHAGALVFSSGRRSVPLKAPQLKTTQRKSPFSVKAGGGQLKLSQAAKLAVDREGFGNRIKVSAMALSAKVAVRLGKKLHLHGLFVEGQPFGSALTKAEPETIAALGKGEALLDLDPVIEAKLRELFVAVNPIFPAEHIGATFTLPIFGGTIAPDASVGVIQTSGALELLQLGAGQVFWQNSWLDLAGRTASPEVDIQPSPPYAGKVGRIPVGDLEVSATSVSSDSKNRTVTVDGAALTMQAGTASIFNESFARPQDRQGVFAAGEKLGTLTFTVQGQ